MGTTRITRLSKVPKYIRPGKKVSYHSIIGGPVTEEGLLVKTLPQYLGGEGPKSNIVVWLEGKTACVAVEALSQYKQEKEAPGYVAIPAMRLHIADVKDKGYKKVTLKDMEAIADYMSDYFLNNWKQALSDACDYVFNKEGS